MFNKHETARDACQLFGKQAKCGYHWWWHSFTGHHETTGAEKSFFVEYFLCNPALGGEEPVFGQLPENRKNKIQPSYLMVNVSFASLSSISSSTSADLCGIVTDDGMSDHVCVREIYKECV